MSDELAALLAALLIAPGIIALAVSHERGLRRVERAREAAELEGSRRRHPSFRGRA